MKIEYSIVKKQTIYNKGLLGRVTTMVFYMEVWSVAWESGVHGTCALKAAS
jgi:hypothetical protein